VFILNDVLLFRTNDSRQILKLSAQL